MPDFSRNIETIPVYLSPHEEQFPLSVLDALAQIGSFLESREELDWWFKAALTHPNKVYDEIENREKAFELHGWLLKVIELAHYLYKMDGETKQFKLLASL